MLTAVLLSQFFPKLLFPSLLKAIDAKFTEVAARVGPEQEVMFEEEQITLDIPEDGIVLESGWTIIPRTYPGVSSLLWIHLRMKNSVTQYCGHIVTSVMRMCAC